MNTVERDKRKGGKGGRTRYPSEHIHGKMYRGVGVKRVDRGVDAGGLAYKVINKKKKGARREHGGYQMWNCVVIIADAERPYRASLEALVYSSHPNPSLRYRAVV